MKTTLPRIGWYRTAQAADGYARLLSELGGRDPAQLVLQLMKGEPMGRGGNADVWAIPGTQFVVRVLRTKPEELEQSLRSSSIQRVDDDHGDMNIGQAVASLGPRVGFLRLQGGVPAGFKPRGDREGEAAIAANIKSFKERLREAASMPQSAYDTLMEEIRDLHKRGYKIDPSKSNNLLIDPAAGRFNLVDVGKGDYLASPGAVLSMLMHNYMFNKYMKGDEEAKAYAREIMGKLSKHGLDQSDGGVSYSMELAGMKQ
jgi:hypothetical protein